MTTYSLANANVAIPIPDLVNIGDLWCAYEHHSPPHVVYVNACRLVDVFKMREARDNSEWLRMFANGGGIVLHFLCITDDRNEAMRVAIERCKSLPTMPRCNLHGYNMHKAPRKIICSNGATYKSQNEAAKLLNISQGNLSKHLRGELTSVSGYTFAYVTEVEQTP